MLKKLFTIIMMMLLIIGMCGNVKAVETETRLNIVQVESETKYLENNQGYINKKIIASNGTLGEVTIQLSVSNSKQETQQFEDTEIYLIVEENLAKNEKKLNEYIAQINSLASKVFLFTSKVKIGIIGMKGTISDQTIDETGKAVIGEKDEGKVNGTESNAEILVKPTNDVNAIVSALKSMNNNKEQYNNNLQAAIKLAKSSYSNNTNKILVSLYDNVPSIAIGTCQQITYGGLLDEYQTMQEAVVAKHEELVRKTKTEILGLKGTGIDLILLRPGDTNFNQKWYSTKTGELELEFDGSKYVQELYGTLEQPTYGKMYSLENTTLETVLIKNMYQDFIQGYSPNMSSVVVNDYFPKEITDYYTITVADKNLENVDVSKYETDGYITWNIGTLETGDTATLEYTLKIDNMKNDNLLNKTIATNEKVEITYEDAEGKDYTATLTSSPSIQLTNKQEEQKDEKNDNDEINNQKKPDDTTANGNIPQTGVNAIILVGISIIVMAVVIIMYKKYNEYKDI